MAVCNCLYMYTVDLCFNLDSHSNVGQTVGRPGKKMEPWDSWDHELVSGHVLGDQWLRMATLIVCSKVALRATFLAVWRQTAAARVQIDDVLLHM